MAFHLHRLNLIGEPLRKALGEKSYLATALSQARIDISPDFITELAVNLGLRSDDLLRDLLENEAREWSFFRESARRPKEVWAEAQARWEAAGLSQQDVAALTGIRQSHISETISGKRNLALDWHQARSILLAAGADNTPETLLPRNYPPDYRA